MKLIDLKNKIDEFIKENPEAQNMQVAFSYEQENDDNTYFSRIWVGLSMGFESRFGLRDEPQEYHPQDKIVLIE